MWIFTIIIAFILICCKSVARKVPVNFLLLVIFTLCESYLVAFISSMYTAISVMTAALMTAGMTITLTLYALFTKRDFTMFGGALCVITFSILALCFLGIFINFPVWWHPFIATILIVLYGLYLIYDTQLIAGKGKHSLGYDDYIIGALMLYIDIIGIFLELLSLLGSSSN